MGVLKSISKIVVKISGWKIIGELPKEIKKCVIIVAPHTSMWDFVIGRLVYWTFDVPVRFLIKKEMFDNPFGWLLKKFGGIPVNRGKQNNMIDYVTKLFDRFEKLNVVITPEGTRKFTRHWKKGFYYIALKANVPIAIAFIDYGKKEGGFGPMLYPSGNFDADFKIIEDFYKTKTARHPKQFNLSPQFH
ncbi:MAG: 1-acyl-sn-glycerol-3-phosphate acyltransferase [Lentimicrobiaceae bacterium]|jgi:1-acyl-sn-glycerol-3-phosphate acyltransferase|nr:1-acyl-sn-glycerol-3-phosphate acyltransferase [Lentimicrobiaceae bacterium]